MSLPPLDNVFPACPCWLVSRAEDQSPVRNENVYNTLQFIRRSYAKTRMSRGAGQMSIPMKQQPSSLEFFAGSGLVAYGLRDCFRPVWANDICEKHLRRLRQ